jgi:wobble nucleotide-excising tRNase
MSKDTIKQNPRYQQGIEKISVTEATFAKSTERVIEPSWINFFYGNNGSGKTTISRTIRSAGDCVVFEGGKTADEYNIAVYNQDFVTKDLNLDSLPGVFMLGEENIEDRKQLDAKQEERKRLEEQHGKTDVERQAKEREKTKIYDGFQTMCWKAAARYKTVFGGGGSLRTKDLCTERILKTNVDVAPNYDFDTIVSEYNTATSTDSQRYDHLAPLVLDRLDGAEKYELLSQSITSTADSGFARFVQSIGALKWVDDGHRQFAPKADGKCPYCQQPLKGLGKDIEKEIAACFDGKYTEDCAKLADFEKKYAEYLNGFIETIGRHIAYIPLTGFGNRAEYEKQLELLVKTAEVNNRRIAEKIAKPSEEITLDTVRPYLEAVNTFIADTNVLFDKNNAIFVAKGKTRDACLDKIWALLTFEMHEPKTKYLAAEKTVVAEIGLLRNKYEKEQSEIAVLKATALKLSEKLGGNALPVEVINGLLEKSGFRGFKLANHGRIPDKYVVIREDGSEAQNLSEGERNFIAFLYFYHLVHGSWKKEDLDKPKIVVIDDPVSSMDSGVLFIVGSYVRDLIEDCFCDGTKYKIRQIFVLTHNPYFHKDVSHKYETGSEEIVRKSAFYAVKKSEDNISTLRLFESENESNEIGVENVSPVKTSYDSLWCEYRDAKLPSTLLSVIHRIIEYYFLQICSYSIDVVRERVTGYIDDERKQKVADEMLRYIYDDIHDTGDGIYFSPCSDTGKYKAVFELIFKAMGQEQHYLKMSGE